MFGALQHPLQKMSDRDRYCCLLFDEMLERMSVSIRSLTELRVLRTMEQRKSNIGNILYFSWSVVYIEIGSSQLLTTSFVEALRLTS